MAITYNPSSKDSVLNFILYGLEAASPSLAAIAAVSIISGKKGIIEFFHASFSPKLGMGTIWVPVLIALGIILAAKTLACFFMGTPFQINHLSDKKLIVIAWAFLAEEIGWRGFLHKRLVNFVPEFIAPLILGLIWSLWHYHFFITGSMTVPVVWFVVGCIADSYIYLFLLKLSRGNILIAMLYHVSGNLFVSLFGINPDMNGGSAVTYIVFVIINGTCGIGLNFLMNNSLRRKLLNK